VKPQDWECQNSADYVGLADAIEQPDDIDISEIIVKPTARINHHCFRF
jgi:hypothetical protein